MAIFGQIKIMQIAKVITDVGENVIKVYKLKFLTPFYITPHHDIFMTS